MENPPHVAIVPTPGMGHLIPLTELARRLTHSFNFSITFFIPNDGSPPSKSEVALLQSLPSSISHRYLSPVDLSDLPPSTKIETCIILTLTRSLPEVRDSLRALSESARLVALVVDVFGSPLFDLGKEMRILTYMFFLPSALNLCFSFNLTKLDKMYTCEYRDIPEAVQICPGSVRVHGSDFADPIQDRKDEVYKRFLDMVETYHKPDGIFLNTFLDLEPAALKYLMEDGRKENNIPPVYPIGPVVSTGLRGGLDGSDCLKWLDEQPSGSVLFVSFGSGGTLSHEQFVELAYGLELSGVRFVWVVKSPHDKANATYFSVDSAHEPLGYLPEGFLERTKRLGLVLPSWAPQLQVLGHDSTGGFLTHCGWNSIMESIVHGVPLIAWPLYAEQRVNAVFVTEDIKVAFRVKHNEKGLVEKEHIANYAKALIKGEEGALLRDRMTTLKSKANVAISEGGSSNNSLAEVAQVWMNLGK